MQTIRAWAAALLQIRQESQTKQQASGFYQNRCVTVRAAVQFGMAEQEKTPLFSAFRLENPVRNYAWGSYDGFSTFAGIPQDRDKPSAEYWMGAHPDSPSTILLPDGRKMSLLSYIEADSLAGPGAHPRSTFSTLPFLFKVLSASMPLSLQVHPGTRAAEEGFAREENAGIPHHAPDRSYKDPNHKPELAVGLSPFSALCGFRSAAETATLLGPELAGMFSFSMQDPEASFRRLIGKLPGLRDKERQNLEQRALARAREIETGGEPAAILAADTLRYCYRHYPHDPGALAAFFLQIHRLQPGDGLYIPAGVMHAYLEGTILEVMASSDNVIRCGLTPKHIDIEELLRIIDFQAAPRVIRAEKDPAEPLIDRWTCPVSEFSLARLRLEEDSLAGIERRPGKPEILLCTEGRFRISPPGPAPVAASRMELERGQSIFVGGMSGGYRIEGKGLLYIAGPGRSEGGQS
jgi:mannose-6-phosphate isomerase